MRRSSPRLWSLLSLGAVGLLPVALLRFVGKESLPLPEQAERLSRETARAITASEPYAFLALAIIILAALLLVRHGRGKATPFREVEPATWTPTRIAGLTLTWLVGQALASIPFGLAYQLHPPSAGGMSAASMITLVWVFGCLFGLALPLWLAFRGRLPRRPQVGLWLPWGGRELFWGFLAFLSFPVLVFAGSALSSRAGDFDPFRTNPIFYVIFESTGPLDWLLLFLVVAVLGPALEELLFRGLLYRSLRSLWSPLPAIFISAVFFASIHSSLATLLPIALIGMALAILYERTGSIVPGMVAHGLYNASVLATLFLMMLTMR